MRPASRLLILSRELVERSKDDNGQTVKTGRGEDEACPSPRIKAEE
jgi:hypothetical protein